MRGNGWILAVALAAFLSACSSADDTFGNPADGYPGSAREVADAADWSKAETLKIDLAEFSYSPETLVFRLGQPYILNLVNTGSLPHRFVAKEFFRAEECLDEHGTMVICCVGEGTGCTIWLPQSDD